jgi:hypothetical protein
MNLYDSYKKCVLKTLWEKIIFNQKNVIIKKLLNILAKFLNWDDSGLKLSQTK